MKGLLSVMVSGLILYMCVSVQGKEKGGCQRQSRKGEERRRSRRK